MTQTEQIIYTPIPNGITSINSVSALQISVALSPTLSGGATGTLSDFSDFQNWPDRLTTLTNAGYFINVAFNTGSPTGGPAETYSVDIDTSVLNPDLWAALFNPPASIQYSARDSGEPYTTTPVVTYPVDQIASYLQSSYTSLATGSPTSYPSTQTLEGIYGGFGFANQDVLSRLNELFSELATARTDTPATGGPPPYANNWSGASIEEAMAALRFYHMPANRLPSSKPTATLPTVDFHRALTFINQHPALQRALGLVLDLTIPVSGVQRTITAFESATVSNDIYLTAQIGNSDSVAPGEITGVSPSVRCNASNAVWEAYPRDTQIVGRQLTLGDTSSFAVYEIDADGGGLKSVAFADSLALANDPQSSAGSSGQGAAPDAPSAYAPPSLRSAGLTVAAVNRGLSFVATLQRSSSLMSDLSTADPPYLTAEDLVRGYVLDVYDAAGKTWNSTALRNIVYTATYTPAGGGQTTVTLTPSSPDEPGLDSPPRSQMSPTDSSQSQFNLANVLIRFTGWSNTCPRPGTPLSTDDSSGTSLQSTFDPGPFGQLTMSGPTAGSPPSPPAGSVPRLRYGTEYALRARIVDIAGNVIPLADGAQLGDSSQRVTPLSVFGRHEPVGSPDIYTFDAPLQGESLKHLVIRDIDTTPTSVRAFAPNRIAESFAELHGKFDTGTSGAIDGSATTYDLIAGRESARYPQTTASTTTITPPAGPVTSPINIWEPITLTDPVPFLPDPLSRGGVLYLTTGPLTGNSYTFDFSPASGASWPAYRPYGLMLTEGSTQAVTPDATTRQLAFALTPGDTVVAQLSSYIDQSDLPTLGMYQWISAFYSGNVPSAFETAAVGGLTWALTPYTTIELIYATVTPLLAPAFNPISPTKEIGWTFVELFGDIGYSPKSTAHTDVLANWAEPVDNGPGTGVPQGPGSPDTTQAARQASPFTIPSSLDQVNQAVDRFSGRHEFFDTKHRVVSYKGHATSAFTEHYPGSTTLTVPSPGVATSAITLPGKPNLGLEPESVVVSSGATVYQLNTAFTVDQTAATITFAKPADGGPPTSSTVTVDFLPTVSKESPEYTLNILSSARPLSPGVEFVVPIYEWSKVRTVGHDTLSTRSPSALRVFLSRPWWSSGIDELLGVITYPDAQDTDIGSEIPSPSNLYVSDWGLDPVFKGKTLPSPHPRIQTFTNHVSDDSNLTIDENASVRVDVAGHEVYYDTTRDLWYADVKVDFGKAYTPMIRLALARWQPNSVTGVELSRIVLADILSLEPGRAAVVVRQSAHLIASVTVAGYSYGHDGDVSDNGPGLAVVQLERRVTSIHDPVIGWEPIGDPIKMVSSVDKAGLAVWRARHIALPGHETLRLWIGQYEVIPDLPKSEGIYAAYFQSEGLRLAYQDIIPL